MLDKLFDWGKKKAGNIPNIRFGRYSDNNKSVAKTNRWTDAENCFKEKKYAQSLEAFFDYLRDDEVENVNIYQTNTGFSFEIYQGSKVVRGTGTAEKLSAEVSLALMPQPSVPVMRRLLEQNFSLYYSRYALNGDKLCMRFDSDIETANPNKLYYALKELATRSDKQDDLLLQDFSSLQKLDTDHLSPMSEVEKETRVAFLKKWINETIEYIKTLDAEKFCGGISYLLLALAYRIDYLLTPEGSLQAALEKITILYFTKDEKPALEKNIAMLDAFLLLKEMPEEEVYKNLFQSKSSFAIVAPQTQNTIAEVINNANNNMIWYRDNNYPLIASQISEYGLSFCQFNYSLPKPVTALFQLLMHINYQEYFMALGFTEQYYDAAKNRFFSTLIIGRIIDILNPWKFKYPKLEIKTQNIKFENIVNFNFSFTTEIALMNFDVK